jgi:hypothetical protein
VTRRADADGIDDEVGLFPPSSVRGSKVFLERLDDDVDRVLAEEHSRLDRVGADIVQDELDLVRDHAGRDAFHGKDAQGVLGRDGRHGRSAVASEGGDGLQVCLDPGAASAVCARVAAGSVDGETELSERAKWGSKQERGRMCASERFGLT